MNKLTPCPNCGRDSILDLCCADCTRAYQKGQAYGYESGKKDERKRIVKWIKTSQQKMMKSGVDSIDLTYLITSEQLKELEKGEA